MLLEELCASLVTLFGHLHPGGRVLRAEHLREVELPFTVPPALSLSHAPQLRVLCHDVGADGQLVGYVLHTLWKKKEAITVLPFKSKPVHVSCVLAQRV